MKRYKELRSGQIITPANDFLRKLYERQPHRYEKLSDEQENEHIEPKPVKTRRKTKSGE